MIGLLKSKGEFEEVRKKSKESNPPRAGTYLRTRCTKMKISRRKVERMIDRIDCLMY